MNTLVIRIICLVVGYAFGSIQSAYFYGKMTKGIDIREHGSGNAGTTNTIRVLGTKAGVIVLLADAFKCIIPMLIMGSVFGKAYPDLVYLFKSWTFLGAVLGHDYPFYMNFKGGKGVACLAGFAVAYDIRLLPLAILLFFVPFFITHTVSMCSLILYSGIFLALIVMGQTGLLGAVPQGALIQIYVIQAFLTFLCYWRHRANIGRLLNGKESKIYLTKKK